MSLTDLQSLAVLKQTLAYLVPEIVLIVAATAMTTAGAFTRSTRSTWAAMAGTVLVGAIALVCFVPAVAPGEAVERVGPDLYASVVAGDALAGYARLGLLLAGLVVLALAHDQVDDERAPEFFGCLLFVQAGAMLVASANELVFLFAGLELVSIPTYFLLYLPRRTQTTQEAAAKYFFLSILSSALLLFGMAYLYGLTGASNLKALAFMTHWNHGALQLPQPLFASIALVFIMAGLGFRVAAVPFHFYAPDVYQGSPTAMAALLSWVPKAVGFVAMLRVLTAIFGLQPDPGEVSNLVTTSDRAVLLTFWLAAVTLTLGNTVALAQDDLKRLLAYSSIAHAGYLLIGVAAAFRNGDTSVGVLGADAVVFYLGAYALMTLGAFGVVLLLDRPERPVERIDDLAGLARTRPLAALALGLCLLSLAGVPPLVGFWGKFRIFQAALGVAQGSDAGTFLMLTIIGVLNAAIGAYYYLRILVVMTLREPTGEAPRPRAAWPTIVAVGACASLSLLLGLVPEPLAAASRASGRAAVTLPAPRDPIASPGVVNPPVSTAAR